MFINLNPDSDIPVFQQIHDEIVLAIARGQLSDGDKLDPVRRVAKDIGINPATVKKAYTSWFLTASLKPPAAPAPSSDPVLAPRLKNGN